MIGNFCGSNLLWFGSSDDFVGLYFHDIPTLITLVIYKIQYLFMDKQSTRNPRKFEPHRNH